MSDEFDQANKNQLDFFEDNNGTTNQATEAISEQGPNFDFLEELKEQNLKED